MVRLLFRYLHYLLTFLSWIFQEVFPFYKFLSKLLENDEVWITFNLFPVGQVKRILSESCNFLNSATRWERYQLKLVLKFAWNLQIYVYVVETKKPQEGRSPNTRLTIANPNVFMTILASIRKLSRSKGSDGGPVPYASSSFCVSASFASICSSNRGMDFYIGNQPLENELWLLWDLKSWLFY